MDRDRLGERLLATFVGELEDQVQILNADLLALESSPSDTERVQSVFRVMHTLKGAARAANVPPVEEAAHALEGSLAGARDGRSPPTGDQIGLLFEAADAFTAVVETLRAGGSPDPAVLRNIAQRAARVSPDRGAASERTRPLGVPASVAVPSMMKSPKIGSSTVTPAASSPRVVAAEVATPVDSGVASVGVSDPDISRVPALPAGSAGPAATEQVRVVAGKLDDLLSAAAASLAAAGAVSERPTEIVAVHDDVIALEREWKMVVTRHRRILARMGVAEPGTHETDGMSARLRGLALQVALLARQSKEDSRVLTTATSYVTENVRRLRMRPFAEICESLPRVVRDVSVTVGKQVDLVLGGQDIEADRAVLDSIREPLVHLVRNAVDHGIELPDERVLRGKPAEGTVTVTAGIEGDTLRVSVSDDGMGLDADAVRAGLAKKGRSVQAGDSALAEALLEGGVSTRAQASMVSGRGVGLDVVRAAVATLGGTISLSWQQGRGTSFVIRAPISLATLRAMIVSVTGQLFAIPLMHVERVVRILEKDIAQVDGRAVIRVGSGFVPIASLARILGPPLTEKDLEGQAHAVIVRVVGSENGAALLVDQLIDEREVVVRALDRVTGAAARNFAGVATLVDERIALILNVGRLVSSLAKSAASGPTFRNAREQRRPRILVVDDSITTRTLEESVLSASGFDVTTAVNGAAAWSRLQVEQFDLLLSDVEMPLMDGIVLTETVRASPAHKTLPIILVTSLDKPEQRERGLEAGADAYLAKATFDQDALVATVRRLIGDNR